MTNRSILGKRFISKILGTRQSDLRVDLITCNKLTEPIFTVSMDVRGLSYLLTYDYAMKLKLLCIPLACRYYQSCML